MGFYIEELPTELNGITMQEADYLADEFLKDTPCNRMWDAIRALRDFYEIVTSEAVDMADRKTENSSEKPNNCEPQTDCYVSDLCKHYGDKQICGRCRSRNLFCEAEPQPRCPKCGKRGYIRSLESMGVKLKVFDEYKWKCTNCNKYFKDEPKDEPQTERSE